VRVLDHVEKRRLRRAFSDQPERCEADQEHVGSSAVGNPERRLQRASLRVGKETKSAEQGK
jgi:hypothetical protein